MSLHRHLKVNTNGQNHHRETRKAPRRRTPLFGGSVRVPTVAFSSFSEAAALLRLPLATGLIWMLNFLGSSSSKSESLE